MIFKSWRGSCCDSSKSPLRSMLLCQSKTLLLDICLVLSWSLTGMLVAYILAFVTAVFHSLYIKCPWLQFFFFAWLLLFGMRIHVALWMLILECECG